MALVANPDASPAPRVCSGVLLQATYRIHHGVPVVYLFGRADNGDTFMVTDNRQSPHFFIAADDRDVLADAIGRQGIPPHVKIETSQRRNSTVN